MSTAYRFPGLDTEPHPRLRLYSVRNYAEVAPARLSVMTWSLVGVETERATRKIARLVSPTSTWWATPQHAFTGYFACRPYHNVSGFARLADEFALLTADDVADCYFESISTTSIEATRTPPLRAARNVVRLSRMIADTSSQLRAVEARMLRAELLLDRDLGTIDLGRALHLIRAAVSEAWDLHMRTTIGAVGIRRVVDLAGSRLVSDWGEVAAWLGRPRRLEWEVLGSAALHDSPESAFLAEPFYEVANGHEPWSQWAVKPLTFGEPTELQSSSLADEVESAIWDISGKRGKIARPLLDLLGASTAWREYSKSLVLRSLHCMRLALPALAATRSLEGAWPYLTIAELADPLLEVAALRSLAAERADDVVLALATEPAIDLDFSDLRQAAGLGDRRVGRGVSAGTAVGPARRASTLSASAVEGCILVADRLDADAVPLIRRAAGILTAHGSVLSHVAALARECGIPAVVGYPDISSIRDGQMVTMDGTTGAVNVDR